MQRKMLIVGLTVFLATVFLSSGICWGFSFPLPASSKVIYQDVVEQPGNGRKDMTICESELSEEQIASFYKREFESKGYMLAVQQPGMHMYTKGEDGIMVVITPKNKGEKTKFILTATKINKTAALQSSGGAPTCEDIPSVPVFPKARCGGSTRFIKTKTVSVNYTSPANKDEVADYYRNGMARFGWKLDQDKDVGKELIPGKLGEGIVGTRTPAGGLESQGIEAEQLIFLGLNKSRCTILLMRSPVSYTTMINIIYEEEPKI